MVKLIKNGNRQGIDEAITNAKVEKKVLERLRLKAWTYGTDPSIGADAEGKINVEAVVAMYEVWNFRCDTPIPAPSFLQFKRHFHINHYCSLVLAPLTALNSPLPFALHD